MTLRDKIDNDKKRMFFIWFIVWITNLKKGILICTLNT